ncbi:MAG: hypothetical protein E6Z24_02405 [Dialister sp.]|nr:hypothetical protein [Dialister sp.]MDU5888809.1 hypothetical protein [Dialister sp.]
MDIENLKAKWEERIRRVGGAYSKQSVVFIHNHFLHVAQRQRNTLLHYEKIPLAGEGRDAVIKALRSMDGSIKSFILIYNFSDLRTEVKQFPQMTEDELSETMYWEQDRIFGVRSDLQIAWRVLEKDATGWRLSLAAAEKEQLQYWKHTAALARKRISRIVPVTEIRAEGEYPRFCFFAQKNQVLCIFRAGKEERTRVIPKNEAENVADKFVSRLSETYNLENAEFLFLPFADCPEEDKEFWRTAVHHPQKEYNRPEEEEENFIRQVMISVPDSPMNLLSPVKKKPLVTEENKWLRAGQILAVLFFTTGVILSMQFLITLADYKEKTDYLAESVSVRKEMAEERENREKEKQLLAEIKERAEKNPPLAGKLLVLADSVPKGIILHEITAEGTYLSVKGSAATMKAAGVFKGRLERIWQGAMTIRKKKIAASVQAVTFEIEGERAEK